MDSNLALDGTNQLLLWEAMTATTAAPVLAERITVVVNGETKRLADGGVVANNPIGIALHEAACLWPNRPIGIVVSFDLYSEDSKSTQEYVDLAQEFYPQMKFFQFLPPVAATDAHALFSSKRVHMQEIFERSRKYIHRSDEARQVLELLRASGKREVATVQTKPEPSDAPVTLKTTLDFESDEILSSEELMA